MIRNLSILLLSIFFLSSCNDKDRESYDSMSFPELLTSLVIEYVDLETISQSTNISPKELVYMKYGIIEENEDLTDYLRDLKYSYDKDKESDIVDLLDGHKFEINKQIKGKSFPKEKYKDQEYLNNEKFQEELHILGERLYNKKVDRILNERSSFWGKIKTGWGYMFSSKETFVKEFKDEIQEQFLSVNISDYLQKRINAYVNMLVSEHLFLYGHKENIPPIKLIIGNHNARVDLDEESEDSFLSETVLDSIDKVDINFISVIIDGVINTIINKVSSDEPYENTQEIIHEQIYDFMNGLDIWILTDLNKITQTL